MRTGIYVLEPTTVTVRATDDRDGSSPLLLYAYRTQGPIGPGRGQRALQPGIYMIASVAPLEVAGDNVLLQAVAGDDDKDDWPEPPPRGVAAEPGATAATVKRFFSIVRAVGD